MRKHECPAPTCKRMVPHHQYACRVDWYRLPYAIRRAILDTYQVDEYAHQAAMADAFTWYHDNPKSIPKTKATCADHPDETLKWSAIDGAWICGQDKYGQLGHTPTRESE